MLDVVLHTGAEHPNLIWIVVSTLMSFLAGIGVGMQTGRVREWFQVEDAETTN